MPETAITGTGTRAGTATTKLVVAFYVNAQSAFCQVTFYFPGHLYSFMRSLDDILCFLSFSFSLSDTELKRQYQHCHFKLETSNNPARKAMSANHNQPTIWSSRKRTMLSISLRLFQQQTKLNWAILDKQHHFKALSWSVSWRTKRRD